MQQPFLPLLGATDASTVFGLGATTAEMSCEQLQSLSTLSARAGEHVSLVQTDDVKELEERYRGPRRNLDLALGDFRVVLSVQVASPQSINLEEARALIVYVRWILRTGQHFGKRLVVLLDSSVVIGAVTKGRSSSIPLNRLVRRLAALTFAGGLSLFLVFVPSAHNPADWPSRGGPATWPACLHQPRLQRPRLLTRMEQRMAELELSAQRLLETGMLSGDDPDFSDSEEE